MIGGFTGMPVACSTGPGSPIPTPARSSERPGPPPPSSAQPFGDHPVQHSLRAVGHVLRQPPLREHVPAEVRDGDDHVRGPDVDRQH